MESREATCGKAELLNATGNIPEVNTTDLMALFVSQWPVDNWKRLPFFDENYLSRINTFWLQFPPPSPYSHYLLAVLYTVIMIVGVSGNILVIFMFIRRRTLRTPANVLIMNLAFSDLFLLLKTPFFIYNSVHLGPVLGEIGCSMYGFLGGLTGIVSIMTLSAVALDRCQVIVNPLARKTKRRIYVQIILIWLYGGFFATLPILDIGLNRYVPEGYLTSCSFDYLTKDTPSRITVLVLFTAAWVVPLCIITVSYAAICRVVLQTRKGQMGTDMARHCKEMEIRRTELKVAVVVIGTIGLWVVSWTPYAVVALLGISGNEKYITPTSSMIPALFCKAASCVDPFVYAVTHPRFRSELIKIFRKSQRIQMSKRAEQKETCWTINEEKVSSRRESVADLEEMVVVVNAKTSTQNDSNKSEYNEVLYAEDKSKYPFATVRPPSWYESPFYTTPETKRSTSFRSKARISRMKGIILKEPSSV